MLSKNTTKLVASEPYRIFFPVALVAGVIGVLLWPAFYGGWLSGYPLVSHARVMIEGFVGGFAIGFLGTALPKMLDMKPLKMQQVLVLLGLHMAACLMHVMGMSRMGDALFCSMMLFMFTLIGLRLKSRGNNPAPGMLLAGLGLFCGMLGAGWHALVGYGGSAYWMAFTQRLLYQAFILLPLLGIGCYIFPMILGSKSQHSALAGKQVSKAWKRKALECGFIGILVILSYWVEVHGQVQKMSWVRFLICSVWLAKESGCLQRTKVKGAMVWSLRAGIACLLAGMVAVGMVKGYKIALDHTLYIGGFGLITVVVGTRVIFGHSGQAHQFQRWLKPMAWVSGLLLMTMLTRVFADVLPHLRVSHHIYAACLWVVASVVWGIAVLPSVWKKPLPSRPKVDTKATSILDLNFRR